MNTPVSFELAKLLREKEFDGNYFHYWNMVNHSGEWKVDTRIWEYTDDYIEAPTIVEVVMWLYEKYGIWIEVSCHTVLDEKDDDVDVFYFVIRKLKPVNILYSGDFVNSPTEAYEAAIEYVLKNLIQEEEQEVKIVNLQDKGRERIYEKILNRKME